MTWEEVLFFDGEIKYLAKKWSSQTDPSLYEDAVQHTYIALYEKVDLTKARGIPRNFVLGAVNNILYKFFRSNKTGKWNHLSLDKLYEDGVQIDQDVCIRWPVSQDYKGGMSDGND